MRDDEGFTEADMLKWEEDLARFRPDLTTRPGLHMVLSFTCGRDGRGMVLQCLTKDGLFEALYLNACVAQALRQAILECGQAGRWMDDKGGITYPTPQPMPDRNPDGMN